MPFGEFSGIPSSPHGICLVSLVWCYCWRLFGTWVGSILELLTRRTPCRCPRKQPAQVHLTKKLSRIRPHRQPQIHSHFRKQTTQTIALPPRNRQEIRLENYDSAIPESEGRG